MNTTLIVLGVFAAAAAVLAVRAQRALIRRMRSISSVLAAYRLGDFSVRATPR